MRTLVQHSGQCRCVAYLTELTPRAFVIQNWAGRLDCWDRVWRRSDSDSARQRRRSRTLPRRNHRNLVRALDLRRNQHQWRAHIWRDRPQEVHWPSRLRVCANLSFPRVVIELMHFVRAMQMIGLSPPHPPRRCTSVLTSRLPMASRDGRSYPLHPASSTPVPP